MIVIAVVWLVTSTLLLHQSSLFLALLLLVTGFTTLIWCRQIKRLRLAGAGLLASVLSLTATFTALHSHQLQPEQVGKELLLSIRIQSIPERDEFRMTFYADVVKCWQCEQSLGPKRIKLAWYGRAPELSAGDIWQLPVKLKPPRSLRNSGGFDRLKWSIARGIHASGYVRNTQPPVLLQAAGKLSVNSVRQDLVRQLGNLPSADPMVGVVQALSLGIKGGIDAQTRRLLQDTGTAHLLAISGLHISMMAFWGFVAGRALIRLRMMLGGRLLLLPATGDMRSFALWCSFLFAFAYTLLAGFELPTQRALTMVCVSLLAIGFSRKVSASKTLAVAAILVLMINPLSPLTVGFWLSFGTVALLLFLHRGHQRGRPDIHASSLFGRWVDQLKALSRTHLLIGLCLLPITAWFFQTGSLVAPLANLLAVPFTGFVIVPLSLVSTVLAPWLPSVADLTLWLVQKAIIGLLDWLTFLEHTVPVSLDIALPNSFIFALTLLALLCLCAPRGLGIRWLCIPLAAPALSFNLQARAVDGFELHVLDVGQGLSALVFTSDQTLLFDTGGKVSNSLSMFEAVVEPYLLAQGRTKIDTLVVSHGDEDHAFGIKAVARRFPKVHVISSRPLPLPADIRQKRCLAGSHWDSGDTRFAFLHPASHDIGSTNNLSCVLLVYQGDSRVLLTGDIERAAENQLLDRLPDHYPIPVSVLVAPHHGSASSSTEGLIDAFDPEYVVFPAGYRNRYAFPHSEVQLRYELRGTRSFITGYDGTVSFRLGNSGLYNEPDTWWNSHRRFWHVIVNPDCWRNNASWSLLVRMLMPADIGKIVCGK